jgi:hypothetical protein
VNLYTFLKKHHNRCTLLKTLIQLDSLLLLAFPQLFRSTCVSNIPGVLPVVGFLIVVGVPPVVAVFIIPCFPTTLSPLSVCVSICNSDFLKFLIFVAIVSPTVPQKGPAI